MSPEERRKICNRIILGVTLVQYEGVLYCIKDPSPWDEVIADAAIDDLEETIRSHGVLSEDEIIGLQQERNIWSGDKEDELENLHENVKTLRKKIPDHEFQSIQKRQLVEAIEVLERRIAILSREKHSLDRYSTKYAVSTAKYKHHVFQLTTDLKGNRIWTDYEAFLASSERLILKLMNTAYFDHGITESVLREIVRYEPWKSIWLGGCKVGNLFGKPSCEWTDLQRTLVSWAVLYDNIAEHPEAPGIDVLDNDILLDAWMQAQSEKRKNKSKHRDDDKWGRAQEVMIPVDTPEDAERVFAMNGPLARQKIRAREAKLEKSGVLAHAELPDVDQELRMEWNRLQVEKIRTRK